MNVSVLNEVFWVAGVETQTLTVWRQANKYNVPSIVYLNKMDKRGANMQRCLHSIQEKLHVTPLLLQLPLGVESSFCGCVDLVSFDVLEWDPSQSADGAAFTRKSLLRSDSASFYKEALSARSTLIGELAEHDEQIADFVLGEVKLEDIPVQELQSALRRVTVGRKVVPVVCGSSLKNKGVQPLLDAVIAYLPSPNEVDHAFAKYYGTDLCALAFKVSHHKQRGPLIFLRLYTGSMDSGSTIYNVNQQSTEKISRILQVFADELEDVSKAVAGNIVAVAGLKQASVFYACCHLEIHLYCIKRRESMALDTCNQYIKPFTLPILHS
jgi:elongation factor G